MELDVSMVVIFETASMVKATKVKACYHPLQVSDVTILLSNWCKWKFRQ